MGSGAITSYIDVAQVVLYAFWVFFAGLIYYLHRENKREGYPLESERSGHVTVQGYPAVPEAKTYLLRDGSTVVVDGRPDKRPVAARPFARHLGAPLEPTGDPLADGVGPAAYAQRADVPDTTADGVPKMAPLRAAPGFHLEARDPDPRGMTVVAGDRGRVGTVVDVWVDRAEVIIRYYEVELAGGRRVLLPHNVARVHAGRGEVAVRSLYARHFANVPGLRNPEQVTLLEEEKIMAYYAGGNLYADAARQEPLL